MSAFWFIFVYLYPYKSSNNVDSTQLFFLFYSVFILAVLKQSIQMVQNVLILIYKVTKNTQFTEWNRITVYITIYISITFKTFHLYHVLPFNFKMFYMLRSFWLVYYSLQSLLLAYLHPYGLSLLCLFFLAPPTHKYIEHQFLAKERGEKHWSNILCKSYSILYFRK